MIKWLSRQVRARQAAVLAVEDGGMDVLSAYKYLRQVYPADFINSLDQSKDGKSILQSVLTSTGAPARELWRQHLEACLALAHRHHLLEDPAFLSRLRSELQDFDAAFSELGAALYFEQAGGEVEFQGPSHTGKRFEFRVAAAGGKVVNAEVKAMLQDRGEPHRRTMRYVKECIRQVKLPFHIAVSRVKPDLRFSRKRLRTFLESELGKLVNDAQRFPGHFFPLPRYDVDPCGFRATFRAAWLPDAAHARLLTSSRGIWLCDDGARVAKHLKRTHGQLPRGKVANLAIVDATHTMWLQGREVLTALYGGDHAERGERPGEFVLTGCRPGFWARGKNRRVSGVMLIRWLVLDPTVPQAHVLHNPWASVPISRTFFPTNAVRFQFCPHTATVSYDPAAGPELWF